jgi:hypothetical protein
VAEATVVALAQAGMPPRSAQETPAAAREIENLRREIDVIVTSFVRSGTRPYSIFTVSIGQPASSRLFLKKRRISLSFPVQSKRENA